MQTLHYILISLIVVILAIIVLVRLYRRSMHIEEMAKFYYDRHWWEKEEGVYCRVSFMDDPFIDKRITRAAKYDSKIKDIKRKFKKDPKLLKETERAYYERQQQRGN